MAVGWRNKDVRLYLVEMIWSSYFLNFTCSAVSRPLECSKVRLCRIHLSCVLCAFAPNHTVRQQQESLFLASW
jgi:hypothetical protein